VERATIERSGGNAVATLSALVGVLALAAGPAGLVAARMTSLTLHEGIAIGGAAAAALGIVTLVLARRGRFRAQRSVAATGTGAARAGRLLGTLALCAGIAGGIALATNAVLVHFQ
jgi:hypothetical protein